MIKIIKYIFLCLFILSCTPPIEKDNFSLISKPELKGIKYLRDGIDLLERFRYREAEKKLLYSKKLLTETFVVDLNLASLYIDIKDYHKAEQILDSISNKQHINYLLIQAKFKNEKEQYLDAVKIYNKALSRALLNEDFDNVFVSLYNIAKIAYISGDNDLSLCSYSKLSMLNKKEKFRYDYYSSLIRNGFEKSLITDAKNYTKNNISSLDAGSLRVLSEGFYNDKNFKLANKYLSLSKVKSKKYSYPVEYSFLNSLISKKLDQEDADLDTGNKKDIVKNFNDKDLIVDSANFSYNLVLELIS